jgi:hypothetical protein
MMPGIPSFLKIIDRIRGIHEKKNADYAAEGKHFENFERQALIMSWFNNDIDKAYVGLIAVKLARLATLLNKKGTPNNESIQDSFDDLMTYAGLWGADYSERAELNRQIEKIEIAGGILVKRGSDAYICFNCGAGFNYTPIEDHHPITGARLCFDSNKCRNSWAEKHKTRTSQPSGLSDKEISRLNEQMTNRIQIQSEVDPV